MKFKGKKVLIMGLGLHGGGLETAKFMLKRGAEVTVTDLRNETILEPSIKKLNEFANNFKEIPPVNYILGKHNIKDFETAQIVVKNPGVKPDSPFLNAAKTAGAIIETDISLFLQENPAHIFAVTGTKGKSGTASALYHILNEISCKESIGKVFLGGNITVSPLTFLDELTENDDVVLELSSFQLGDLKKRYKKDGTPLLKPKAAILTQIMADHMDRYSSMNEYIDDKRVIYKGQDENDVTVSLDDDWGRSFLSETKGKPISYSVSSVHSLINFLPNKLLVPGEHQKTNLMLAALAVYYTKGENEENANNIRNALSTYRGIEHRLELFLEKDNIKFYNDSAATIPEAAAMCVHALSYNSSLILVTGGTDKNLDFTALANACSKAKEIILLTGTGSEKLAKLLDENKIEYSGPYDKLEDAVKTALVKADTIRSYTPCSLSPTPYINIVLSPGCASFGMFLNEFDRGKKWKEIVSNLA